MSVIDVEQLLAEISPDSPCGEDLEYDPEFGEMERAAEGKEEQQFGDTIIPAEDPDWKEVQSKAIELFSRTKDLRIAVHLARSLLALDGVVGFREGILLIQGMIERYWETLHPQLDADDDNDPTIRINVLVSLCDSNATLSLVHRAPLVDSLTVGRFSLRDIDIASGDLPHDDAENEPPQMSTIEAAFLDCDVDNLRETGAALDELVEGIDQIELTVTGHVGAANAASFDPLAEILKRSQKVVNDQLQRRGAAEEVEGGDSDENAGSSDGSVAQAANPLSGDITSREDVIRTLDRICEYYDRYEPSSPLPLLLQRAKRLATKTFMEIIRDLTPDGVTQAESIGGVQSEESDDADEF